MTSRRRNNQLNRKWKSRRKKNRRLSLRHQNPLNHPNHSSRLLLLLLSIYSRLPLSRLPADSSRTRPKRPRKNQRKSLNQQSLNQSKSYPNRASLPSTLKSSLLLPKLSHHKSRAVFLPQRNNSPPTTSSQVPPIPILLLPATSLGR